MEHNYKSIPVHVSAIQIAEDNVIEVTRFASERGFNLHWHGSLEVQVLSKLGTYVGEIGDWLVIWGEDWARTMTDEAFKAHFEFIQS